jgi:HEAT repeat protein
MAIPMLVAALNHKESAVRLHGIRAIGKIGSEAAVIELARSLESEDSEVQAWAAWALAEIDSKPAASALLKALNHQASGVRVWGCLGLGQNSPQNSRPRTAQSPQTPRLRGALAGRRQLRENRRL